MPNFTRVVNTFIPAQEEKFVVHEVAGNGMKKLKLRVRRSRVWDKSFVHISERLSRRHAI